MKSLQNLSSGSFPQVTYFRDPALPGLEVSLVKDSTHAFPKHFHDDLYVIGLMHQGQTYGLGPEHSESLICSGEVFLVNPGQVHSGVPTRGTSITYRMLYLNVDMVRSMTSEVGNAQGGYPEFRSLIVDRPACYQALSKLCDCLITNTSRLEKESVLLSTLGTLMTQHGGVSSEGWIARVPERIQHAKDFLLADLSQKVSLAEVAEVAGMSRYYFLRQFKALTGVPPHVFRTQQRIAKAKQLLLRHWSFSAVAMETGFTDQSHFTNIFRQYTGATPGQYSRSARS